MNVFFLNYTFIEKNVSDRVCDNRWLENQNHLLQDFVKGALFKDEKSIEKQIDTTSLCEISYYYRNILKMKLLFFLARIEFDLPRNAPIVFNPLNYKRNESKGCAKVTQDDNVRNGIDNEMDIL